MLAYDDADLRVVFQPGGSDVLLVTFGDAATLAHDLRFTADALARRQGLSALGFMAHAQNWFPAAAVARALPHIAYTLKSFDRRLLYGSSMGGYAALKYARLLGATDIAAFAPQWSIDEAECAPWQPGYQECFRPDMTGMGIGAQDMAGRIAIFVDPGLPSDMHHVHAITQRNPRVAVFPVHSTDHNPGPALAGSETMWRILSAWLAGDHGATSRALNAARRASPIRTRVLLGRAVRRHPALALRAIEHVLDRGGGKGVDSRDHVGTLLSRALDRGEHEAARAILRRASRALPALRAEALGRDLAPLPGEIAPPYGGLVTAHGTELLYDLIRGALCHEIPGARGVRPAWRHPVTLGQAGADVLLAVDLQGKVLACALDIFGRIELADFARTDPAKLIKVAAIGPGRFTLQADHRFLCATPEGDIHHDRRQANDWEVFFLPWHPAAGPAHATQQRQDS